MVPAPEATASSLATPTAKGRWNGPRFSTPVISSGWILIGFASLWHLWVFHQLCQRGPRIYGHGLSEQRPHESPAKERNRKSRREPGKIRAWPASVKTDRRLALPQLDAGEGSKHADSAIR